MPIDNLLLKAHRQQLVVQQAQVQAPQAGVETSIQPPQTMEELATVKTTEVVPQMPIAVDDKQRFFKDKLDQLDALIMQDNGISQFTIDDVRRYVKEIMMTLHTEPELDAILIDRDVHNILRFIRHVKDQAFQSNVDSGEKRVAKSTKAKANAANAKLFANMSLNSTAGAALPDFGDLGGIKK